MNCEDCSDDLRMARVVGKVKRRNGIVTRKAGVYCNKCGDIRLGTRDRNGKLTNPL